MGAWVFASRVRWYEVMYGYGGNNSRDIEFDLHLDDHWISISSLEVGDTTEHGPILGVTVKFGDYQANPPGGAIGHASSVSGGGHTIAVELPRDEVHTFWRSIRDVQEHILTISMNENDDVTGFGVNVAERLMVETDEERRERINSMLQRLGVTSATERLIEETDKDRRERVNSMLQRLGVTSASS
jgi:hypothetical protein